MSTFVLVDVDGDTGSSFDTPEVAWREADRINRDPGAFYKPYTVKELVDVERPEPAPGVVEELASLLSRIEADENFEVFGLEPHGRYGLRVHDYSTRISYAIEWTSDAPDNNRFVVRAEPNA